MLGPDAYYTPIALSTRLLSYAHSRPNNVADFCVGDGDLLSAAELRFPGTNCYGIDISADAIDSLRGKKTYWKLACCDFRDRDERIKVPFLIDTKFDMVLLNPPFTCRGSNVEIVMFEGTMFHVSKAMSFILDSMQFLSEKGELYAILPISCVYSQKDEQCWRYLCDKYYAAVLTEIGNASFPGNCAPNVVMVYLGNHPYPLSAEMSLRQTRINVESLSISNLIRGRLCVHEVVYSDADSVGHLFVHTSNMRNGRIENARTISNDLPLISGPGVLVPRVCNPSIGKIILLENADYIISDCVFFLKTRTKRQAYRLKRFILDNWTCFSSLYVGTGARYITIKRLCSFFNLSFDSKHT